MKQFIVIATILFCSSCSLFRKDQSSRPIWEGPIFWRAPVKKISTDTFEIQFTAFLRPGWYIYASKQPGDTTVVPTAIVIDSANLSPNFETIGEIKDGDENREYYEDTVLGTSGYRYSTEAVFVQRIRRKTPNESFFLHGQISFQVCMGGKCEPPGGMIFYIPSTKLK